MMVMIAGKFFREFYTAEYGTIKSEVSWQNVSWISHNEIWLSTLLNTDDYRMLKSDSAFYRTAQKMRIPALTLFILYDYTHAAPCRAEVQNVKNPIAPHVRLKGHLHTIVVCTVVNDAIPRRIKNKDRQQDLWHPWQTRKKDKRVGREIRVGWGLFWGKDSTIHSLPALFIPFFFF